MDSNGAVPNNLQNRTIPLTNTTFTKLQDGNTMVSAFKSFSTKQTPLKNSIGQAFNLFTSNQQFNALLDKNPFTLFAPTDSAIKLAKNSLPNNDTFLMALFSFHLLPSKYVPSVDRVILPTFLSAQGPGLNQLGGLNQSLVLNTDTTGSTVQYGLGNAKIVESIDFGSFIIHVVDTVFVMPIPLVQSLVLSNFNGIVSILNNAKDSGTGKVVDKVGSLKGITFLTPLNNAVTVFQSKHKNLSPETFAQVRYSFFTFLINQISLIIIETDCCNAFTSWSHLFNRSTWFRW